jgi:cell shape-determining protein MreD
MILKNKRRLLNFISLPSNWWLTHSLKWLFFIILTFTLQTQITVFETPFNFIVVIVYLFALQGYSRVKKDESSTGMWEIKSTAFGASIGILDDLISGALIGPSFLSKGLIGYFIAVLFGSVFFRWTPLLGIIVVFVMTIFDGFIQVGIRLIFGQMKIEFLNAFLTIIIQALVNLPLGLLLRPSEHR